jgi:hypothetical protein
MTALDHLAPTIRLLGLALPKDADDPVELARVLAARDPDTLHRFTAWGLDCAERVVRSDADRAAVAAGRACLTHPTPENRSAAHAAAAAAYATYTAAAYAAAATAAAAAYAAAATAAAAAAAAATAAAYAAAYGAAYAADAAAAAAAHAATAATAATAAPSVERIWQLDRLAYCLTARDD